jgi:hypothetical protein
MTAQPDDVPHVEAPPLVVEREDGMFQLGWHDDAPGPFESRTFAEQVAAVRLRRTRHLDRWLRQ